MIPSFDESFLSRLICSVKHFFLLFARAQKNGETRLALDLSLGDSEDFRPELRLCIFHRSPPNEHMGNERLRDAEKLGDPSLGEIIFCKVFSKPVGVYFSRHHSIASTILLTLLYNCIV